MNKYKILKGLSSLAGALLVLLLSHSLVTQAASAWTRTPIDPHQTANSELLSPGYSQPAYSGSVITFAHVLTNVSALADSFMLTATSSHDWPLEFYGSAGVLSQPLQLEAGLTTTVLLQIVVPSGIVSGTIDTAIITATSQTTPTLFSESVDTTLIQNPLWHTYLPLVLRPLLSPTGINGRVTYQGNPVSNMKILLDHCYATGIYWICMAAETRYTFTRADGFYEFTSVPSLGPGWKYVVRCSNYNYNNDPQYVAAWNGASIYAYTANQTISGGDFEIANVPLVSPSDTITTGLPIVFQWTPRAISPSDSYQLQIWDVNDESIYWTSPLLGYVGSYTLNSLPPNFTTGTQYAWDVIIHANGGSGVSYETRIITFSGTNRK